LRKENCRIIILLFCFFFAKNTNAFPVSTSKLENEIYLNNNIFELTSDMDNDEISEKVILFYGNDFMNNELIIMNNTKTEILWISDFKKIWKVQIADIDGDGFKEIVTGVWKYSPVYQTETNCLSIHNWEGNRIIPKWRGSTLSKPFYDFILVDVDGDKIDELVTLEKSIEKDSRNFLVIYKWIGFGFTVTKQYEIEKNTIALTNSNDNINGTPKIFLLQTEKMNYQINTLDIQENRIDSLCIIISEKINTENPRWINISLTNDNETETLYFYKNHINGGNQ
jgi:hypothetical protein